MKKMKNVFFQYLTMIIFLELFSIQMYGQEKLDMNTITVLSKASISQKMFKGKTINVIKSKDLKPGYNLYISVNKRNFFLEVKDKKAIGVVITKTNGEVQNRIKFQYGISAYQCSGAVCECQGDDDCNDMITNAGCGYIGTEVDGHGWCFKEY
jgi:hypothetical protein